MVFFKAKALACLWLLIAAFFVFVAIGQVQLMLAPVGSDDWRHSEWAPAAFLFALAFVIPFGVSGIALLRNWRWRRLWQLAPALALAAVLGLWAYIALGP